MIRNGTAVCPGCGRQVSVKNGVFIAHRGLPSVSALCFMSDMPMPFQGRSPAAMEAKAHIVARLAVQVQDEDPTLVWHYLTAAPAWFLQELLQVALAGIDVEGKRVEDIWGWVGRMPASRLWEVSA